MKIKWLHRFLFDKTVRLIFNSIFLPTVFVTGAEAKGRVDIKRAPAPPNFILTWHSGQTEVEFCISQEIVGKKPVLYKY